MDIVVSTYCITRNSGGVLDAVKELFLNHEFSNHKVAIYSFTDEYIEEDLKLWRGGGIHLYNAGPLLFSNKYISGILKSKADILHLEALWRYPQTAASKWKKFVNKPVVCSPHGMLDPWIIKEQGWIKRIFANIFFQKSLEDVTCYHALCQKEREDIRQYGLKQPIAVIPNGIHLPDKSKVYKKSDDKRHLLYLGRLHTKKGVDILLNALADIHKEFKDKDWVLDIVGWDNDGTLGQLKKIVSENNLEDVVFFHGGLFGDDKIKMYATSDAYILPSHGEGLPMTVLEAWAWNLPVIITPQCHLPEGYEFNAAINIDDNKESVKRGLLELIGMEEEKLKIMGDNGYNLVAASFTWEKQAEKMIKLYQWLLNGGDKPDFVYIN